MVHPVDRSDETSKVSRVIVPEETPGLAQPVETKALSVHPADSEHIPTPAEPIELSEGYFQLLDQLLDVGTTINPSYWRKLSQMIEDGQDISEVLEQAKSVQEEKAEAGLVQAELDYAKMVGEVFLVLDPLLSAVKVGGGGLPLANADLLILGKLLYFASGTLSQPVKLHDQLVGEKLLFIKEKRIGIVKNLVEILKDRAEDKILSQDDKAELLQKIAEFEVLIHLDEEDRLDLVVKQISIFSASSKFTSDTLFLATNVALLSDEGLVAIGALTQIASVGLIVGNALAIIPQLHKVYSGARDLHSIHEHVQLAEEKISAHQIAKRTFVIESTIVPWIKNLSEKLPNDIAEELSSLDYPIEDLVLNVDDRLEAVKIFAEKLNNPSSRKTARRELKGLILQENVKKLERLLQKRRDRAVSRGVEGEKKETISVMTRNALKTLQSKRTSFIKKCSRWALGLGIAGSTLTIIGLVITILVKIAVITIFVGTLVLLPGVGLALLAIGLIVVGLVILYKNKPNVFRETMRMVHLNVLRVSIPMLWHKRKQIAKEKERLEISKRLLEIESEKIKSEKIEFVEENQLQAKLKLLDQEIEEAKEKAALWDEKLKVYKKRLSDAERKDFFESAFGSDLIDEEGKLILPNGGTVDIAKTIVEGLVLDDPTKIDPETRDILKEIFWIDLDKITDKKELLKELRAVLGEDEKVFANRAKKLHKKMELEQKFIPNLSDGSNE